MATIRAVASARVSRAGAGKHLPYISRPEALQPDRPGEGARDGRGAPVFEHHVNKSGTRVKGVSGSLPEKAASREEAHAEKDNESSLHEANAIWTWNAPSYITGDSYGTQDRRSGARRKARLERGLKLAGVTAAERPGEGRLTLEEKAENAHAYFSLLSDAEKKKGGVNSYRLVLSVSGDASEHDLRGAVNEFLREAFPKAQALVAVHHNTEHIHAHVYVHSRQLDGTKVDLKQDYFRLDERWARVCAEHFRDPSIYEEHMRLKAETRQYRKEERRAREVRETLPDKPDRWADRFEVLKGTVRPWDDRYVGRLMAVARVAESRVEYLKATNSAASQVADAEREALELKGRLQSVSAKRALARSEAKRSLPAEVITVEEQRELAYYSKVIGANVTTTQQRVPEAEGHPLQASFDFETGHALQLTLGFGSEDSSKQKKKAKKRSGLTPTPHRAGKDQPHRNQRDEAQAEREILGRAMVTGAEVERLRAELTLAREHGDRWQLNIYDATHKRERIISEFEIRRRCEARATRAVHDAGAGDSVEWHRRHEQELESELAKHRFGIAHHREVVGRTIQSLEERLSAAQQQYDIYRPQAIEIQARYAATNTRLPLPVLSFAELNGLQDQAIFDKDTGRFLALENIREGLAVERGEKTRTDHELARLRAQLVVSGSEVKAHEHRGEEFNRARHLTRWAIDGEAWSLTDLDRQIGHLQERARVLVNPHALIPRLAHPVHQATRLAITLGKNLNLSSAKREQAAREMGRLQNIREQVESQIIARGELLKSEMRSAATIHEALAEVCAKEVSRCQRSGRSVPTPALTGAELSRLGANAQLVKDADLVRQLHLLEEEHLRSGAGDKKARARKLCGRAAGREIVAEVIARESEAKLLEFEARKKLVHVVVKDSEGRDLSLSLADLREPRRLVEYMAKRVFESGERKRIRREVEGAVKAEHLHLREQAENARQVLDCARHAAQDYQERLLGKTVEALAPIFTPKEINAIEFYSIRQADPKVADHYNKLIKEAEKEGRVLSEARSVPAVRENSNRNDSEKRWSRPQSPEERKVQDAHAWALRELKTGGQREILLRSPEEYAVALSAKVRNELSEQHGLSVQTLGYTRESWADTVLLHVRSALNGAGVGLDGPTFDRGVKSLELLRQAIEKGDERKITRLSGSDPRSKESESQERLEQDFEQKRKGRDLTQGQDLGARERKGTVEHDVPDVQEKSKIDRLEHLFFR